MPIWMGGAPPRVERKHQEEMGNVFFYSVARWDNNDNRLAAVFATATGGAAYSFEALEDDQKFKFMTDQFMVEHYRRRARIAVNATLNDIASRKQAFEDVPTVDDQMKRAAEAYKAVRSQPVPKQ